MDRKKGIIGRLDRKFFRPDRFFKRRSQPEDEFFSMVQGAIDELAADGLIYDTGRRRWSERTQSYQIVWAAVPGKQEQS